MPKSNFKFIIENNNIEETLKKALGRKLSVIEIKREVELKEKLEKKKEDTYLKARRKRRASIACIGTEKEQRKTRSSSDKKSFLNQERKLHEAYQLIIGEHHRKLNQRRRSVQISLDSKEIERFRSISLSYQPCHCLHSIDQEGIKYYIYSNFLFNIKLDELKYNNLSLCYGTFRSCTRE